MVEQEAVVRDGHRHGELVKVVIPAVRNKNICVGYLNEISSIFSLSLGRDERSLIFTFRATRVRLEKEEPKLRPDSVTGAKFT